MSLQFYAYARKGYEFIEDVARELNVTDTEKAGRLTRCVIRAVRNRLTVDDSFSLLAQLPMALKGVYVDGWKIPEFNNHSAKEYDFVTEVMKEDDNSAWHDFSSRTEVKNTILAVFTVFAKHFGEQEFNILCEMLPNEIKNQLNERVKS